MKQQCLNKLINKQDLPLKEAKVLMKEILEGKLTSTQIAALLVALRMKGESVDEIVGFIKVMREHMQKITTKGIVIDTCGTGGDRRGTFNISTASAFVVTGAGVHVAKHGNRSASSLCGSADVLEALGININLSPEQAEKLLQKTGFTFLFAPLYHPSMQYAGPVRKELKIRTVFNFLGPFVNPARVKRQIIGVADKNITEKLALVATQLHYEHLLIISSSDGLDEISISADTLLFEVKRKKIKKMIISPKDFGMKKGAKKELIGGNRQHNAKIIRNILLGEKGPRRDIVILNSAAAIYVAGKVKSIKEGVLLAEESIDSGRAQKVLTQVIHYSHTV